MQKEALSDRPTRRSPRGLLLLPAGLCLLAGLDAALVQAGTRAPWRSARLADVHGPVMVLGVPIRPLPTTPPVGERP